MNESQTQPAPFEVSAPAGAPSEPRDRAEPIRRLPLRWAPQLVAALVALCSLLLPLAWSGLWSPYELDTAEFSRRIAVALHGAERLVLPGANNAVPTLSELGRGQLPFSSVAVGFQIFGLRDWAGRLPLALWGLLGIAATFVLVSRLFDRFAAAYASVALASMPLYFLQSRTLLGDIVPLSTVAVASCALGLALFQPGLARPRARFGWCCLALAALAAGFVSRGLLLGVACPALGVGLGWLTWRCSGRRSRDRFAEVLGCVALGLGALALGGGLWALFSGNPDAYLELLGAAQRAPSKLPTHDQVLHQLGFGLFPWSAFAPFALAIALGPEDQAGPESALGVCLVGVFAVALAVHGISSPHVGALPFVGTFALAALIGIAFRRIELGVHATRLAALGSAALLIVFTWDLRTYPEESLLPFALPGATFPESFAASAKEWMKWGALPCLALLAVALADLPRGAQPRWSEALEQYSSWLRELGARWNGQLLRVLGGLTLLLGAVPVLRFLDAHGVSISLLDRLGIWSRPLGYAFLIVPFFLAAPLAASLLRELSAGFSRAVERLPLARARLGVLSLAGFGLALSLGYYPALAAQLSPRDVFESFRQRSHAGEQLAVLGQASKVAPYYAGAPVETPSSARIAFDWLLAAQEQRRWLLLGAKDLAQLNSLYRQRSQPAQNLPILDAASSEVLLASNVLAPNEHNDNPIDAWLSHEAPQPERPLDVDLSGQLRCIGWGVTLPDGQRVTRVSTGQAYEFRIYWQVLQPISSNWKTFIHIDGKGRRFNGDHDTLEGKYPFKYWLPGDFVTDVYRFQLEPHYSGATYQVYFGLFIGDRRLAVRSGKHTEDRIIAGSLVVD